MNRQVWWRGAIVAVLFSVPACTWLRNASEPSIEFGSKMNGNENGTAYERATVEMVHEKTIVLPDTATIRQVPASSRVEFFMAKSLGYAGFPAEPMSVRDLWKSMGCALKVKDGVLLVSTYGEWSSIEGGASLKLVVAVPEGIAVRQLKELSGDDSLAQQHEGKARTKPGWTPLASIPDPLKTAK